MKKYFGFNLIETMTVITIAGILLAIAIPAYRAFIQNNRALSFSQDFIHGVHYARSEAVKRSSTVSMCAASSTALTACGSASQWLNGWLIFSDANGNGVFDAGADTLLATHQSIQGQGNITAPAAAIIFNSAGFINAGAGVFQLSASGCVGQHGRSVSIANSGRISVGYFNCS